MPHPVIDYSKGGVDENCTINVCPANVFEKEGDKIVVKKPADCIGCRACEMSCTTGAIKIVEE